MNNEKITMWMELLELSCRDMSVSHIDIIVDQVGSDFTLIPTLATFTPSIEWTSLFNNIPEEMLYDDAPLLIRLDWNNSLQRQWLIELARQFGETEQLIVLCSGWPFKMLSEYLTDCIEITCGSQNGIFRYYDPRLFPFLFSHVLNVEQQKILLKPAFFWSWLDRDTNPRSMSGDGTLYIAKEKTPKLELNDLQQEYLMCVADVNVLLKRLVLSGSSSLERLFTLSYEGMIAATDAGLLMDDERESFVIERILINKI